MGLTDKRKWINTLLQKLLGIPYIWGGDNPHVGFDCSGLVVWVLQVFEVLPSGDWTADMLMRRFSKLQTIKDAQIGDLVFYGEDGHATHVGFYIGLLNGEPQMIGANGGGSSTINEEEAKKRNAKVKMKPVMYRGDYLGVCNIDSQNEG